MSRPCEVCSSPDARPELRERDPGGTRRLLVEERIVSLCDEHAAQYRLSNLSTLSELRSLFAEEGGNRSLIARRSPLDRRIFPARPEGRRRDAGRRSSD